MAKHFEAIQETDMAIKHYIESGTYKTEVPRMLVKSGAIERLQEFVQAKNEPELYKWWAAYLETQGLGEQALPFYQEAQDFGACVRLYCELGDVQGASKIAMTSSDPRACFNLARYFEVNQDFGEAIIYYGKSGRLSHAIRLAKESGYDQQVMTMSLTSSKPIMIQSAQYFE